MTLDIPFTDISRYVAGRYQQQINLATISNKEIEAVYRKKIVILNLNVKIEITIERVLPSAIIFSYDGNSAVEFAISKALTYLMRNYPAFGKGISLSESKRVVSIDLAKIEECQPFINIVALKDITIKDESILIEAALK